MMETRGKKDMRPRIKMIHTVSPSFKASIPSCRMTKRTSKKRISIASTGQISKRPTIKDRAENFSRRKMVPRSRLNIFLTEYIR